jgi:hypothetical protein
MSQIKAVLTQFFMKRYILSMTSGTGIGLRIGDYSMHWLDRFGHKAPKSGHKRIVMANLMVNPISMFCQKTMIPLEKI